MKQSWFNYLPLALVIGWWLYDLQFQWRQLAEYNFGWLVLLLVIYLSWERRSALSSRDDTPASFWIGAAFALLGTPFVLLAELYKQAIANSPAASFCLSLGCLCFVLSNVLYLHGWRTTRHFLFPLLFFLLAVPLPGIIWTPIVLGLKTAITSIDVEALNLIGIPAMQQANVIRLPACAVGVDEACSGIRSLQSSFMAALFIGNLKFRRASAQSIFFIMGIGLALTGNFLRSLFLAMIAHHKGLEALKQFHDSAGWSIFAFTAVGLLMVARFIGRIEPEHLPTKHAKDTKIGSSN